MDKTDMQARTWLRALELAGYDAVKVAEMFRQISEAVQILAEEAIKALNVLFGVFEENYEELKKYVTFDSEQTARKKKRHRDRRQAAKIAHAVKFSRYNNRRLCCAVKRRTQPRARERGPPADSTGRDKSGKGVNRSEAQTAYAEILRQEYRPARAKEIPPA